MKTKYLDFEINYLEILQKRDELTEGGEEKLIEFKSIKEELSKLHQPNISGRSEKLKCDCGETENVKKIAICACCYNPNTGEW
jgi:hypothetical protein